LRTSLSLSGARSVSASGVGIPAQTDSLSGSLSQRLDDNLSLVAGAAFTSADTLGGLIASKTRSRSYSATLSWQVDREWVLEGGARLASYELPGGQQPRSGALFIGLRYRLPEQQF
jgi:hypothetical protein